MTELEMSLTLGIVMEPEQNRIRIDAALQQEIMHLKHIFQALDSQKSMMGEINPDVWIDLLPWHSLN